VTDLDRWLDVVILGGFSIALWTLSVVSKRDITLPARP
jgi:hypothetical protein